MKDNFSKHSKLYSQFRPVYPKPLYDFLLSIVEERIAAWDCGTGNGQVAAELAGHFREVFATDISANQISNAVQKSNIHYKVERAEDTSFNDRQFDLVTVAQAIHWFDFDPFYKEVKRVLKPNGTIAVIGYQLMNVDIETDKIIMDFYNGIIGKYWDKERKYIDEHYKTIPFPFNEIKAPELNAVYSWTFEQLIGYLTTWSAVQHYISKNGTNPIDLILPKLKISWDNAATKEVQFPLLLRVGKLL